MKIALAQINSTLGDFELNTSKILSCLEAQSTSGNAPDLIVFPELALLGYAPNDLLERKEFVEECLRSIERVAQSCQDIAAIVGGPAINQNNKGKKLYNAAFFLNEGESLESFTKAWT